MIGSQSIKVYAGDINGEEARLLEYVNKTFELDGLSYKVNEAYKTKLKNKLLQDDIDLAASDVEMIIGEINNNVLTGVENDYLVLTEEDEQEPEKVPETEASQGGGETTSQGTKEEGTSGSGTETNGKETETLETETSQNTNKDITKDTNKDTTGTNTTDKTQSSDGNALEETTMDKEETANSQTEKEEENGSEMPLKNTGYSLKTIPYIAAFLGSMMVLGILSVYLLNYVEVLNEKKK